MLDITTLVIIAGLFLGLVVGDAVVFGDRVQVQITVSPKVAESGFTGAVAEQVFAAHVSEMDQPNSIIDTPSIQVDSQPQVFASLARPLSLENAVIALQNQAGFDVMIVRGVVLADTPGDKLTMLTIINVPGSASVQFSLKDEKGDAGALVRRAAEETMAYVSPYHLALTLFDRGLHGDPALMQRAQEIAARAIERPRNPDRATERAMLHNLLAMMAMLNANRDAVHTQFELSEAVPDASHVVHGIVELNRAFWDVAIGQPDAATSHYLSGKALTVSVNLHGQKARTATVGALIAWSLGDIAQAEAMFREAISHLPEDDLPYMYLGHLLDLKGDPLAATAVRDAANARRFDARFPAQAVSIYWLDPVHGGGIHVRTPGEGTAWPTAAAAH